MGLRSSVFSLLKSLGWIGLVAFLVFGVVLGLLIARPWEVPHPDCSVTVKPGESIQAAVDAAAAGSVICLGRGEWTENIVIDKPLTLVGSGAGRTIIDVGLISQPVVGVSGQDTDPIEVKIEGLTMSGAGLGSGVEVSGLASVEVRDCRISGRAYGVQVSDSAGLTLIGCTVSDTSQRGVFLTGSARADITGSRIEENRRFGIWVAGSAQLTLVDSEVSANGSHGFWVRDEARVELSYCLVSRNRGHGVWLTGQSSVRLSGCRVSGNSDHGIIAEDSVSVEMTDSRVLSNWHGVEFASQSRATVTGTTVSDSRFDGVRVRGAAHAAISSSVISAGSRGLWLAGQVEVDISDCVIEENAGYGVFSWYGAEVTGQGNLFRGNGVDLGGKLSGELRIPLEEPAESKITWPDERYESLQAAIDALVAGGTLLLEPGEYKAGLTIGKELVVEAGDGEVTLKGKTCALPVLSLVDGADLHLSGVVISGGAEGLLISGAARAVLSDCTVSGNTDGVNPSHSSSVELIRCYVDGNERYGLYARDNAEVTVVGCRISNNSESGVAAADMARVTISDSTVSHNGGAGGIVFWGSCQVTLEGNTIAENHGFGAATRDHRCFHQSFWSFRGRISGSTNVFEANRRDDVCPPDLGFLSTSQGGELDRRP